MVCCEPCLEAGQGSEDAQVKCCFWSTESVGLPFAGAIIPSLGFRSAGNLDFGTAAKLGSENTLKSPFVKGGGSRAGGVL